MGAIEDTRKVLQDFLAPEMREIKSRLDALEKRFDGSDRKMDDIDRRAEKRHEMVMQALSDYTDVRVRFAILESRDSRHQ
jgi:uncharacterized coiled-coil DUF342 family protein